MYSPLRVSAEIFCGEVGLEMAGKAELYLNYSTTNHELFVIFKLLKRNTLLQSASMWYNGYSNLTGESDKWNADLIPIRTDGRPAPPVDQGLMSDLRLARGETALELLEAAHRPRGEAMVSVRFHATAAVSAGLRPTDTGRRRRRAGAGRRDV